MRASLSRNRKNDYAQQDARRRNPSGIASSGFDDHSVSSCLLLQVSRLLGSDEAKIRLTFSGREGRLYGNLVRSWNFILRRLPRTHRDRQDQTRSLWPGPCARTITSRPGVSGAIGRVPYPGVAHRERHRANRVPRIPRRVWTIFAHPFFFLVRWPVRQAAHPAPSAICSSFGLIRGGLVAER